MHFRRRINRDRAENARQAEHVLRLKEGAVGIAVHLDRDARLFARLHELRNVEARGIAGILGEADVLAVHPHVEERIDAVEVQKDLASLPVGGNVELAQVGPDFVAVEIRRARLVRGLAHDALLPVADGDLVLEDHRLIDVHRQTVFVVAVALLGNADDVPVRRHRNLVPARRVEAFLEKVLRAFLRRAAPVEFPRAVERAPVARIFRKNLFRGLRVGERRERRARHFFVQREIAHAVHVARGIPFVPGRRGGVPIAEAFKLRHGAEAGKRDSGQNKCENVFFHKIRKMILKGKLR